MINFSETILHEFPLRKVVIVGDLMSDQFLNGTIARVSREAPVFILSHEDTETLAGGAANAAVNVASLGGQAVVVGLIGKDPNGDALLSKLRSSNVNCDFVTRSEKIQTTTKVRVLAGHQYALRQQVIRIDFENKSQIDQEIRDELRKNLVLACEGADAIIISDYCLKPQFGVVNDEITETARTVSEINQIPLVVDSRFRLAEFTGVTSATPNQDEVNEILKKEFSELDCVKLLEDLGFQSLLVTRGNKGMLLIEKGKKPLEIAAVGSTEPVDVTGAGDTVIAAYTLSLASGLDFACGAEIANHAGGIVVMKKRTAAVSAQELLRSIAQNGAADQKIRTL